MLLTSLCCKKIPKFNSTLLFLMMTVLLVVFSARQALYFPIYAMIYALYLFGWVSLTILFMSHFTSINILQRQKIISSLFFQICLTLSFISLIVFVQLIKRAPLGLIIESTGVAPLFGAAADESTLVFRPVGLSPHANMMANRVFILWLSLIIIYLSFLKKFQSIRLIRSIFITTSMISLLAIVFSQSRSIYIGVVVFLTLLLIWDYSIIIKWLKLAWSGLRQLRFMGLVLLLIGSFTIANRAWYSFYSFTETGGFIIRKELNREAISLLKKYPVWGVGPGMFIPALAGDNPMGVIRKFPEAVHNGFLLFAVENGLLAQGALMILFFLLIKNLFYKKLSVSLRKAMIIGFISQLMPMFFQPFINYWTIYTTIILIFLF